MADRTNRELWVEVGVVLMVALLPVRISLVAEHEEKMLGFGKEIESASALLLILLISVGTALAGTPQELLADGFPSAGYADYNRSGTRKRISLPARGC